MLTDSSGVTVLLYGRRELDNDFHLLRNSTGDYFEVNGRRHRSKGWIGMGEPSPSVNI